VEVHDLLGDAFSRIHDAAHAAVEGLSGGEIVARPDAEANTIAWLVWHLTRVEDHHVSELAGRPQVWTTGDWNGRFGTDPDPDNTGYAHTAAQVAEVVPDRVEDLLEYFDEVHQRTLEYVQTITPDALDRIVDRSWDPPVTAGVRLISVINDTMQHAGQANYLRGLIERGLGTEG
jgi:uncharacterized damage-inducible protein DinB